MRLQRKRMVFSGIVTSILGIGLGWVLAYIFPSPYHGWNLYHNLERKYMITGSAAGFLIGICQEAIRQIKKESDRQDPE